MIGMKGAVTRAAMSGLYHSGAHRLLAPYTQGAGVIFTLNQVRPPQDKDFAPNRGLEVAPGFLEAMLDQVEEAGLDVVTLDEAARRLREDDERRFVCFTFDQAYRNTLRHAYPLFQQRSLPLTLYVATDYASGWGELWWLALEEVIARASEIELCRQGGLWRLPTATAEEKQSGFEQIFVWLRSVDEARQRRKEAPMRRKQHAPSRRHRGLETSLLGEGEVASPRSCLIAIGEAEMHRPAPEPVLDDIGRAFHLRQRLLGSELGDFIMGL